MTVLDTDSFRKFLLHFAETLTPEYDTYIEAMDIVALMKVKTLSEKVRK